MQLFLGTPALSVDARGVQVQGGEIGARHLVWATGVRAPRLLAESGLHVNADGRALVDRSLAATGHSEVLVLGVRPRPDWAEAPLPSSAQVAVQEAICAADNLAAALRGRAAEPFMPWLEGEALALGPHDGLARVGRLALVDAPAVLVKRLAVGPARYLSQLGGPARLPVFQCARQHLWEWMPQPTRRTTRAPPNGLGLKSSLSELPDGHAYGSDAATRSGLADWRHVDSGADHPVWVGRGSPSARRVHAAAFGGFNPPIRACVLETPAGFEPNSARVAGLLADFLRQRLSPFQPEVVVVPARRRGTPFSPDHPDVVAPLLDELPCPGAGQSDLCRRQLAGSLAWHTILARHRLVRHWFWPARRPSPRVRTRYRCMRSIKLARISAGNPG